MILCYLVRGEIRNSSHSIIRSHTKMLDYGANNEHSIIQDKYLIGLYQNSAVVVSSKRAGKRSSAFCDCEGA
jgi:hypothetical protein